MPDRKELIVKRLMEEGEKTEAFFRALQPADWEQQVYATGPEWGARDLLHHFISAERMFATVYADIQNGGPGVAEDFDIDAFNAQDVAELRRTNLSIAALIAEFGRQRAHTVALVKTFDEAEFDRVARHPWFGLTALENMLKLIYRHTMLHQRDIGKAIETGHPVPPGETSSLKPQISKPQL